MYLSRIRLLENAPNSRALWRFAEDGYGVHRMIWKLLSRGPDCGRDFLYRQENQGRGIFFYTVSTSEPLDPDGLWEIDAKRYEPKLRAGQRLRFLLRANPVRRKRDAAGRQHRHDVIMEAKTRLKENGTPRNDWPTPAELEQEQGTAWLAERAERHGFTLEPSEVRVEAYRQHSLRKPGRARAIRFSTVDFRGMLAVSDADRFLQTLYSGLGPAKGFGCGLLLIRPG